MVERRGVMGRWMGFCYRLGIKPTLSEVEADMIPFCVGLILVGGCGWRLLRPCVLISCYNGQIEKRSVNRIRRSWNIPQMTGQTPTGLLGS